MKELKMPANYEVISAEETVDVYGGGTAAQICYALGRMFQNTTYTIWGREIEKISESHGGVVSISGNVYTFADGTVHTMESGWVVNLKVGDFFYGLGDFLNNFDL